MNSDANKPRTNVMQIAAHGAMIAALLLLSSIAKSQTCPFDDGQSQLTREGVVLTRYALGLTGVPLVNGTGFDVADAPTIASNIACPSCGLNITGNVDGGGNPVVTVADATIISRKLAGFSGAALTNGVALGSGSRNTTAAVNSFLLSGCGTTPSNAWVNGGNAFGTVGVIGTTDAQQMEVRSGGNAVKLLLSGESGVRVLQTSNSSSPAVLSGSSRNSVGLTPNPGAVVAGGGYDNNNCNDPVADSIRSCGNAATNFMATVGGGFANRSAGGAATVGGGQGNSALADFTTIGGGYENIATGAGSTVPGGFANRALGRDSFAAGSLATARGRGMFVWSDAAPAQGNRFDPVALGSFGASFSNPDLVDNTFIVRATGGVQFVTGINPSGSIAATCWINPGGSGWNCASDRNIKHSVRAVSPKSVLRKLVSVPISTWAFNGNERRQIGPMSQDFFKAFRSFGVGGSETSINSVDAQGVAFAAIQGLHQIVKEKDAEITHLKRDRDASDASLKAVQAEILAIKKRLGM
jgi:trimeric autotransporter adhesin